MRDLAFAEETAWGFALAFAGFFPWTLHRVSLGGFTAVPFLPGAILTPCRDGTSGFPHLHHIENQFAMDFAALRKEYEDHGLVPDQMELDPLNEFQRWLKIAIDNTPGDWFEPNAFTLATSSSSGEASARIVLLKGVRHGRLFFYTNYESDKGRQISANPQVAACFHWPYLDRQVRICGLAVKTSPEDSLTYFHSRPRGAQIGAWASAQSEPLASRETLEHRAAELSAKFAGQPVPLPPHWGGYQITPSRFEFWQGRTDRLHDRIVYRWQATDREWLRTRLSP
ncbi:MAG: pyridoxamine 5'-phosphate oxidase [Blastopirellula sp.]|jgi:pyridoxamine 5'-phosphate oxidase|nr:pyridoxamine 5'-phosphate oxidase [Blastopirellula sp.]